MFDLTVCKVNFVYLCMRNLIIIFIFTSRYGYLREASRPKRWQAERLSLWHCIYFHMGRFEAPKSWSVSWALFRIVAVTDLICLCRSYSIFFLSRYRQNGILNLVERNAKIKTAPERWQDQQNVFDVVITFEEKVFDIVVEGTLRMTVIIVFISLFN